MFSGKRFLAVIPARGGSTRLVKKNTRLLCGKPLVSWSIEAAKESKLLDSITVSTDDEEIKSIANQYGVEIHHRPKEFATEFSLVVDTLHHIVRLYQGFDIVVLNPTSPVRDKGLVDKCIMEFVNNDYDALATGRIVKYVPWPSTMNRTQDIEGFFIDDGAVYVYKHSLIQQKTLLSEKVGKIINNPEESVDIDTEFDFKIATFILQNRIDRGAQ